MKKIALLIGVCEYGYGLTPLPSALKDIEALQKVLQQRDIGNFDEVKLLPNPTPDSFRESVEALFQDRNKNDLILLFFSGHGIKDDNGKLYFATHKTKKNENGTLIKSSAVPASFVQDIMNNCRRCKRQVLILDCCYSGAFAQGMTAKHGGSIDIKTQLGGEGRAILTSSSSTQYSFEQEDSDLSVYTRFIVEGLQTGTADMGKDGIVSIDELHEYARKKVQDVAPSMKPEIIAQKEGYSIYLANAPVDDPQLTYRREVEHFAKTGNISDTGRETLNAKQRELNIDPQIAARIEREVLKPYQEHQQNCKKYEKAFRKEVRQGLPLSTVTRQELTRLKDALGLEKAEVEAIQNKILPKPPQPPAKPKPSTSTSEFINQTVSNTRSQPKQKPEKSKKLALIGGASVTGVLGLVILGSVLNAPTPTPSPSPSPTVSQPNSSSGSTASRSGDRQPALTPTPQPIPEPTSPAISEPEPAPQPVALNPARKYRDPQGLFVLALPEGYQAQQEYGDGFGTVQFNSQDGVMGGVLLAASSFDLDYQSRQDIISNMSNEVLGFSITQWGVSNQHNLNSWSWGFEAVDSGGRDIDGFALFLDDGQDILTTGLMLVLYNLKGTASTQHTEDIEYILENLRFQP